MAKQTTAHDLAKSLSCWDEPVDPRPLAGGTTNTNFTVQNRGRTLMVRIGHDLPLHGIVRQQEVAAARAANACGLSPEIIHHEPGALVMAFIESKTLTKADVHRPETLDRIVDLLQRCHRDMPSQLTGATLMFWVFQVCRQYLSIVGQGACRLVALHPELARLNRSLEQRLGPIEPTFCHNDLLPANILDDGEKLWLLDWEYAGWNTPLFDLANLASNADLGPEQNRELLTAYLQREPSDQEISSIQILACSSLLRELLWSLVQEQHSPIDFDFEAYSDQQLASFEAAYQVLDATR